jgi:hypothetical protein
MSTITGTTTATQAAKALLPMEPMKLMQRAEEMYTSYNPGKMSVDAHAAGVVVGTFHQKSDTRYGPV